MAAQANGESVSGAIKESRSSTGVSSPAELVMHDISILESDPAHALSGVELSMRIRRLQQFLLVWLADAQAQTEQPENGLQCLSNCLVRMEEIVRRGRAQWVEQCWGYPAISEQA